MLIESLLTKYCLNSSLFVRYVLQHEESGEYRQLCHRNYEKKQERREKRCDQMEEREKPISIIPLLPNFCACIRLSQLTKKRRENFGVWLVVFFKQYNTYFHNTFYLHIFPQHLNNARTTLPKSVNYGNPIAKIGGKQV